MSSVVSRIPRDVSHAVAPDRLARKLAMRGLTWLDLARPPLRLSRPTRRSLRRGQPVSPGTLRRLDAYLQAVPVLLEVSELLVDESEKATARADQTQAVEEGERNGARLQPKV